MSARNEKKKSTGVLDRIGGKSEMKTPGAFRTLLKHRGYSDKAVEEIWKWYAPSERKELISKNRQV